MSESAPMVPAPPRIWTVFTVFVLAVVAAVAAQTVFIAVLLVWHVANGANIVRVAQNLPELLTEPLAFMGLLWSSQVIIGAAAILPALLSREPALSRLGLTTPPLPIWGYPLLMLGSGIPVTIGLGLFHALAQVMTPDPSFDMFYDKITWPVAGPYLLFISLVPGFMEEMFFRGYLQCRLLERWYPWAAILVTSALFALIHLAPHTVVFAFPVGIWLGVIAWRTGSVWPTIVCHAFINASGSIYEMGMRLAGLPEIPPMIVCIVLAVAVIGGFIGSVWLLARQRTGDRLHAAAPPADSPSPFSKEDVHGDLTK